MDFDYAWKSEIKMFGDVEQRRERGYIGVGELGYALGDLQRQF